MITKVFTTQEAKIVSLLKGKFDFKIKNDWALISIYGSPDKPIVKNEEDIKRLSDKGCKKVLSVCFGDYTDKDCIIYEEEHHKKPTHINIISATQANSIVRFIKCLKKYSNIETLIVQCSAGISRSGAVGLYACRYYGLDENEYLKAGAIKPNYYVYSKLCSIHNPMPLIGV
jgi:predicted protein tyrosine phosphatase